MACDGGICDCVAVMDDVRPVLVVYICIMAAVMSVCWCLVYTNVLMWLLVCRCMCASYAGTVI